MIDNFKGYACNHDNETGCNRTNLQSMVTRGRAINLDTASGLDLVFVIDASSSVTRDGFNLSLNFAQEFVKIIGLSKRYDKVFKCKIVLHFKVRDFSLQLFIALYHRTMEISKKQVFVRFCCCCCCYT